MRPETLTITDRFKNLKLANKLLILLVGLVTLTFVIMSALSLNRSSKSLNAAISRELTGLANENGAAMNNILRDANSFNASVSSYIYNSHNQNPAFQTSVTAVNPETIPVDAAEETVPAGAATDAADAAAEAVPADAAAGAANMQQTSQTILSDVYGTPIDESGYVSEQYLLNAAWGAVAGSEYISGVGVYFEPQQFNPAYHDYGFYITDADAAAHAAGKREFAVYGEKEYYKTAKSTLKPHLTDPYLDSHGISMVSVSYPLVNKGTFIGIVLVDIPMESFADAVVLNDNFKTLTVSIYDENELVVFDSTGEAEVGTPLQDNITASAYSRIHDGFSAGKKFSVRTENRKGESVTSFFAPIALSGETWWAESSLLTSDLNEDTRALLIATIIIAVLSMAVIIVVMAATIRNLLKPIDLIVDAAHQIETGTLDIELDVQSGDEIGLLSQAFNNMTANLETIIADISYCLGEMANGNFVVNSRCGNRYIGDYQAIIDAMTNIKNNLSSTLYQIEQAADQVDTGAEQVSIGAQALSQGSTEQAASVEELSSTLAETKEQTVTNAAKADAARNVCRDASSQVQQGTEKMQHMISAIQEISEKSNQIGRIIKTIDDIAFQTNILALNAAVEAARAGSAGKGFAVVADEVRNLAQKSAEAAKNTTALIEGAVSAVENGVAIADETASALSVIKDKTEESTSLVLDISDVSSRQAENIAQLLNAIEQISSVVQTNSATAEESAAASEELSSQAAELKSLVNRFHLED